MEMEMVSRHAVKGTGADEEGGSKVNHYSEEDEEEETPKVSFLNI